MKTHILSALVGVCILCAAVRAQAEDQAGLQAVKNGDYRTAFTELLPLAQQGNADAQTELGFMYYNGEGVLQDYKEAGKWFRLSADQGNSDGQYNLGVLYENGAGVPQDQKEAGKWYRLAAEHGNAWHEVWMSRGGWPGWLAFGGTIFFQLLVRDLFKAAMKLRAPKSS